MSKEAILKEEKSKTESKAWQFLCSVKLAVIIIVILAVSCILGTVVLQQLTPEEYVAKYGEGLTKFFMAIQFTDVFHSYWFALLLLLLCVNLGSCTVKRWRNTVLQIGFIITHISIILIMIGCFIDLQLGEKGGVNVYEGKSVNYYLTRGDFKKVPLDFEVHLDDFIIEKHPPKFRLISYVKDKDSQTPLTVKVGKNYKIKDSNYSVTVKEFYPDAEYTQKPVNASNDPVNPAIYVQMFGSKNITAEGWLFSNGLNWYNDHEHNMRIEYFWVDNDRDFEKITTTVGKGSKVSLGLELKDKGIHRKVPVEEGAVYEVEGTEYRIEIKEFALDYMNRTKPIKDQSMSNPAVRVEIVGPDGVDSRWSFSKYPDYWDKAHQTKYKDIRVTCNVPDDFTLTTNKMRIVQNRDSAKAIVYIEGDKIIKTVNWEVGKKCEIGESSYQLRIAKFFPAYSVKNKVVKKSDIVNNPALHVEIAGPRGKVDDWILGHTPAKWYPDNNFALLYEKFGMDIKDFKSKLRVVDNGKTVLSKTIEVNDPLKYNGYVFYQSSYDPEGGLYSGLQVTKNPGIVVVYSGFILLCVGVVFIFYVKPFLRRKSKKKER
ncbi:MAG: cytochrome c biogenesis protein ResB [Planctomycetes bacterium]|nr:cytochrome c biogenesis protein ResB [Planctomycetota bacterium]